MTRRERIALEPKLAAATDEIMCSEVLGRLAADPYPLVRIHVAGNAWTAQGDLLSLAADPIYEVRRRVAGHERAPVEALAILSLDPDASIRRIVARNRAVPYQILARLGRDPDLTVRRAAAKNRWAPADLLDQWSRNDDFMIRKRVAMNLNAAPATLDRLANDPNAEVRRRVARHHATPVEAARLALNPERHHPSIKAYAPSGESSFPVWQLPNPAAGLNLAATDFSRCVRINACRHPSVTAEILAKMSRDPDPSVRRAVAGSRRVDAPTLAQLARDEDVRVRQMVDETNAARTNPLSIPLA